MSENAGAFLFPRLTKTGAMNHPARPRPEEGLCFDPASGKHKRALPRPEENHCFDSASGKHESARPRPKEGLCFDPASGKHKRALPRPEGNAGSFQIMYKESAPQLRLEPGGFRRHDLPGVCYIHKIVGSRRVHCKCGCCPVVDQADKLSESADPADK